jgi:hypothetical protein
MKRFIGLALIVGLAISLIGIPAPQATAGEKGVKVGTLVIEPIAGTRRNLLIRSTVDVKAVFTDEDGKKEHYVGEMGIGLGIDLSLKTEEKIGYIVFSASSDYKTGSYAMQGKYFGAKADATVGVGVGAVVLVGGFDKSFTLQPAALSYQKGFGAAAGASYLYLQKDASK